MSNCTLKVVKMEKERCPECKSPNLLHDYETGETVCRNCGFVFPEPIIDQGPEWRSFDEEERAVKSRVGSPQSLIFHDKSLTTTMRPIDRDTTGKIISNPDLKRIAKWQDRLRVSFGHEKSLAKAMTELIRVSDQLRLPPNTKEVAALILRKAFDAGLARGHSILAMADASVYAACRLTGTLRTLREVSKVSLAKKESVRRCYNLLVKKLPLFEDLSIKILPYSPIECVSKIAESVNASAKIRKRAIEILTIAKEKRILGGRGPMGLAAAALYIAILENSDKKRNRKTSPLLREKNTQRDIAAAAGVTEVTVRNRCKELIEKLNLKIPEERKIRSFFIF
jgi:transcription initiation factor TFIIB